MLDPLIIDASEIGLVTLGVVGIRGLFARAAVDIACRKAYPAIEEFKRNNTCVKPLQAEYRQTAAELLDTIRSSREMRASVIARMRGMKAPNPSIPLLLPELEIELEKAEINFSGILALIYQQKSIKLIKGQVKEGLHVAHAAADYVASGHEAVGHVAPHLSAVEQGMVNGFDGLGVIDLATDGAVFISDTTSAIFGEEVARGAEHLVDAASDVVLIPGLRQGITTVAREFKLLTNDQTSLGDSFQYGFAPAALRFGLTSIGVALDSATGWMSMGAFTMAASWLGQKLGKQPLVDAINEQISILKTRMGIIQTRQSQALITINDAVARHLKDFATRVDGCPDIGDEPVLRQYTEQLHEGYKKGLAAAVNQVVENAQTEIQKLPERNWVDKILFIDRREDVAALYRKAQREIESKALGVMHRFAIAAETHVEDAIVFILQQPTFRNPETVSALEALQQVMEDGAAGYAGSLTQWKGECAETWTSGTQRIATITAQEHAEIRTVTEREERAMAPVRERISVLKIRLGQKLETA